MLLDTIKKNEEKFRKRNWVKSYWLVDIHETMIVPTWESGRTDHEFYPMAKETMQILSKREDICLILYTCSWPAEVEDYLKFFEDNGIHFSYVNVNPEVTSSGYGCFDTKPYMNVLLDDKSGFNAYTDWQPIYDYYLNKL